MTREEIRTIFNLDFERDISIAKKVIDYFENRSCEGCKWWNKIPKSWYICTNTNSACFRCKSDSDFCCKYYEKSKD